MQKNTIMKLRNASFFFIAGLMACSCVGRSGSSDRILADRILGDTLISRVEEMALEVVQGGFNAGDGYCEVWIRDYNTFINLAMEVMPDSLIRDNLLTFFRFQGEGGDIPDGFLDIRKAVPSDDGYVFRHSASEPRYAAYKNTVETDQESSLVQAVWRYVTKSGNHAFLETEVDGKTVLERMSDALDFLIKERYSEKYGLLWGATTADWGDVQPEHPWGVALDENSHLCIDIYDNAFFVIAINHYLDMLGDGPRREYWEEVRDGIMANSRKYLWDDEACKFIPHVYLDGSPFPESFDENAIYYHGGTATAIEAGMLSKEEIRLSNEAMLANVKASGAPTIGLTVYPPYPEGFFMNKGMYSYGYQNGGDWTWFGARMIRQLAENGFVKEAYEELLPMLGRVVKNNGFYEWYALDGTPSGSGTFRGEAGVLYDAVTVLREWAARQ